MASNTNIQVANLDFADIKQNFINYLQSQQTFKDYNFTGSNMSILLDVLAYNTQYNAFYLNMVANEMFLDSSVQRSSVVSHAKMLNYVPKSAISPTAFINVSFTGVTSGAFTLPAYTNFLSEPINNVNYNFITPTATTVDVVNNVASFGEIEIKQGTFSSQVFLVDSTTNPSYVFEILDKNVDTTTISVIVQNSSSNTSYDIFNNTTNYLELTPKDLVYFLQESINGNYQIYFGDGILGKKLSDGNIVRINYVSTNGTAAGLANNFVLMDNVGGNYTSVTVTPYQAASLGSNKESISSIKFQAPKAFASQGRAVSKNDYITAVQQNSLGISFDAVSVWGGEENIPPVYGQVFIAMKPAGAYDLTMNQKQLIVSQVLKPISVLTVEPVIVDTDYNYIQVSANVVYNSAKTTLTAGTLQSGLSNTIYSYSTTNLNTFNSTFSSYDLLSKINAYDKSIISSDFTINIQKKFYPTLGTSSNYNLYFNSSLKRGLYGTSLSSYPGVTIPNPGNPATTLSGVYFEEVPTSTVGVDSISVISTGYNYSGTPTVVITGDGTGATATAKIVNNKLYAVTVTNPGINYTVAIATIVPAPGDTTGTGAAVVVKLQGQYGVIRSYYNDAVKGKIIVLNNAGTIDYKNGIVVLTNFNPIAINNDLGQLTISAQPTTTIISSSLNRIITIDPYDPNAVSVSVTAKKS
jgi:hypothetical protein